MTMAKIKATLSQCIVIFYVLLFIQIPGTILQFLVIRKTDILIIFLEAFLAATICYHCGGFSIPTDTIIGYNIGRWSPGRREQGIHPVAQSSNLCTIIWAKENICCWSFNCNNFHTFCLLLQLHHLQEEKPAPGWNKMRGRNIVADLVDNLF